MPALARPSRQPTRRRRGDGRLTKALLEAAELRGALGNRRGTTVTPGRVAADDALQAPRSTWRGAVSTRRLTREIRQRERVAGEGGFDLATATAEQIAGEAVKAYAAAWSRRESPAGARSAICRGSPRDLPPRSAALRH
jgi:hypothetical protein